MNAVTSIVYAFRRRARQARPGLPLQRGHDSYGFTPVAIPESGRLPFEDGYFDIVYCSLVIEHIAVPKVQVWSVVSGKQFREAAGADRRN